MATFNLCVDIAQGIVLSSDSSCPPLIEELYFISVNSVNFVNILQEFIDVAGNTPFTSTPRVHDLHHHILTEGLPIFSKARNLDSEKLLAAKNEFSKLEKDRKIRHSDSQ